MPPLPSRLLVKRFVPELAAWSWTDPERAWRTWAGIQRAALDVTIETLEQTAELLKQLREKGQVGGGPR